MTTSVELRLELTCVDPPQATPELSFGLQDKQLALQLGDLRPDNALTFTCPIRVRPRQADAAPDFAGPFVHGPRGDRFLYLSLRHADGHWIKRIKISLGEISWALIEQSQLRNVPVRGSVSGAGAARAALLGGGWTVDTA